jgi:serine/threonine protein kinase
MAAAKTVREELLGDATMAARFRREMRIWVGLGSHPNIVKAFFVKDIDAAPFLFMEYMDGGSLFDVIRDNHPIPIDRALSIAKAIADGMSHVHNRITPDGLRGILHRDLKPANILVSEKGDVKIADFGLAGAHNATILTEKDDVIGTIHYSSPEQILDMQSVDERTDIYSFGAILYHVACGVIPFDADTWPALVTKIKDVNPTDPGEIRGDIPAPLSRAIMKCLEKNKEERFGDFGEISACLAKMSSTVSRGADGDDDTGSDKLPAILDVAQQEAAGSGAAAVEPVHLLLATTLNGSEPFDSWLSKTGLTKEGVAENVRASFGAKPAGDMAAAIKFKRSSRRVIGLAHDLARRESMAQPSCKHVMKALLEEMSARDALTTALASSGVGGDEIEDLFDEMEGLFELPELDGA